MPTSARKSSLGASRRGPLKAHVPFRGDNPEVGKKTGYAVQLVERKSDGFEPFEDIIRQADKKTPPRMKSGRKKQTLPFSDEEEDGGGEMSMDMDDSNPNSPMEFFTNNRLTSAQLGVNHAGSSSRLHSRSSGVDFDEVPSPRPRASLAASKRRSMANGSAPGPSNLSKSTVAESPEHEPQDDGGMDGGFDDYGPQEESPHGEPSPRQTSFQEMNQDDEDDDGPGHDMADEPDEESPIPKSKKNKGKEREERSSESPQRDADIEDEIAQGLEDVELEQHSDEGEEAEDQPPSKKSRVGREEPKRGRGRPQSKNKKRHSSLPEQEGLRRGKRLRYEPLEWWRQEKVVYGRRESGITLVPHIKEIRRIPKEVVVPLRKSAKRKRGSTAPRSKSETEEIIDGQMVYNPEEGWDDDTEQQGIVVDFITQEEVKRRIACTAKMLEPKAAAGDEWFFQKVFGDADFIAAGQLIIPPKSRKPSKGAKDNTYVFYVIEGAVNLKVHETSLILATGAMFMVPRGNTYFIENIAERDAKLFFTQARKISAAEEESGPYLKKPVSSDSQQRRLSGGPRSSSMGAASTVSPTSRANGHKATTTAKRAASTRI